MRILLQLAFALAGLHVGTHRVLPVGYAPTWTPSGERIAFVSRGDVWVADADGSHRGQLVLHGDDPAWSPDGRRLAFTRDDAVWTVRADGEDERRLTAGDHPAWSPDGQRIAFDRDGETYSLRWYGGALRDLGYGVEPAFAPDGRLALVVDGRVAVGDVVRGDGEAPAWSPDGKHLAYVFEDTIYVDGAALRKGHQPSWQPRPNVRELLPDLDQRPPTDLTVGGGPGRWLLGFTSLVDNVGPGAAVIEGVRPSGAARMVATQRVRLSTGGTRVYRDVGRLRYTRSPPHYHWHLMRFDEFDLRSLDGKTLVRDRKSGFCLADHWGRAPGSFPNRHPVFLGDCEQFHTSATHVLQGTSSGYTDRYPAFFHGQNVEITGVPAGVYVLVHRANPNMLLRELRYENDAASVRIRLSWPGGPREAPVVRVVRSCPASARC